MQCSVSSKTFLQIVPVVLSKGQYSIKTNAVLDSGSDKTLIRSDTTEALHLSGNNETLRMSNVLLKETRKQSKRVCFDRHHQMGSLFILVEAQTTRCMVVEDPTHLIKINDATNRFEDSHIKRIRRI